MELARLHPQARAALGAQVRAPLTIDNLPEVRASMVQAAPAEVGTGPDVRHVDDVDAGGVRARLYRDDDRGPVLVYAHGGGWVMGDLETHDGLCRHLARASGWAVLAVDYRLAPEAPYPAAVDDVSAAVGWARQYGIVALGGDSAGGQLAAVVARRERDAGRPVAGQVLICPVLDPDMRYPDLDEYGLDSGEMRFFWDAFAPAPVDRSDPDLNPFRVADLSGLPPAVVITAELDVLRDEGERYAAALLASGVPVVSVRHQGVNHNFVRKLAIFDAAHVAVAEIATVLRRVGQTTATYTTRVEQHVRAPRSAVYRALLDADAIARWRVPDGMTSTVHEFSPYEGGSFRISLTYDAPGSAGKSSAHTDTYHGRFVELVPDERVVEEFEFETSDPALAGMMRMTTSLADADGGTTVTVVHESMPVAVAPADNELGTRMALAKLAHLVESGADDEQDDGDARRT